MINRLRGMTKKYKAFWIVYWGAAIGFLVIRRGDVLAPLEEGETKGPLVLGLLFGAMLVSALISHLVLYGRGKSDENPRKFRLYHLIFLILNCVLILFLMEWVNNPDLKEMQIRYMLLNLAGCFIMTMICMCWLNSWKWTMLVMLWIYAFMTTLFYIVNSLRGEPFQFIDVFSAGTAFEVAGNFTIVMSRQLIAALVIVICVTAMYLQLPDVRVVRKKLSRILIRAGVAGFMIGMYIFYLNVNWNGKLGILTDLFAPTKTYKKYGTTVGFFCVAKYMRLTPPDGYTPEETKEIAKTAETEMVPNDTTDVKPVNIIAIMNESWADYRKIGDLQTSKEVMPYYDSMSENTIKGNTLACIRGGGTAKSEYEFLTGNSIKRFPGMVPYVSYFLHDQYSLVTTLKSQGYEAIAMHPYKATNWNRPAAYRMLSFDQFLAEEDFEEDTERIRSFISDRGNYEKIIRMVEEKKNPDDKLFLFDITMQNHGGFESKTYHGDIRVNGYDDEAVNNYLSLERDSDDALKYLIEYFKTVDEPTIILMFGDHYPDLPDEFTEYISGKKYDDLPIGEKEMYFSTPFFIWANYDIPEKTGIQTSNNYLGTMMLEQTGLEMAPYNYFLKNQQKQIPALNHLGYMDPSGTFHTWDKGDKAVLDQEWKYECLQYNNLAENRKRLDKFFTVSP